LVHLRGFLKDTQDMGSRYELDSRPRIVWETSCTVLTKHNEVRRIDHMQVAAFDLIDEENDPYAAFEFGDRRHPTRFDDRLDLAILKTAHGQEEEVVSLRCGSTKRLCDLDTKETTYLLGRSQTHSR
jgi:hypothetical protein